MRVQTIGSLEVATFETQSELLKCLGGKGAAHGGPRYIPPKITQRPTSSNGLCAPSAPHEAAWSGVIQQQPSSAPPKWVTGTWTTPNCRALSIEDPNSGAGGGLPGFWIVDAWVGLAGAPGPLLQAGTWTQDCPAGYSSYDGFFKVPKGVSCFAWIQWHSSTFTLVIDNFPVSPGDSVSVTVALVTAPFGRYDATIQSIMTQSGLTEVPGAQYGIAYVGNLTQDYRTVAVMHNLDASQNLFVGGASPTAEWIVERPTYGSGLCFTVKSPLGAYGEMIFTNAACGTKVTSDVFPFEDGPFFGILGSGARSDAGLIPLSAQPTVIYDVSGAPVSTGDVLFPGIDGPSMVQVYQPWADFTGR